MCLMTINNWCDPRNVSGLSRSCSPNLEHLTLLCCPFYLFLSVLTIGVYIPPHADMDTALSTLHNTIIKHTAKYPDAALIVAGDFQKANVTWVFPNLFQHISCPTRGKNTPFKDSYKASSLPAFGKANHAAIFITPIYKQKHGQVAPTM